MMSGILICILINMQGLTEFMAGRAMYYGREYSFVKTSVLSLDKDGLVAEKFEGKIPLSSDTKIILLDLSEMSKIFKKYLSENRGFYPEIFSLAKGLKLEDYPRVFKIVNSPPALPDVAFLIWRITEKGIMVKELYFIINKKGNKK